MEKYGNIKLKLLSLLSIIKTKLLSVISIATDRIHPV